MTKRQIGDRAACVRCGQDIEWHGRKHGWLDRGSDSTCGPYRGRDGEIVPENHTKKHKPYVQPA